MDNQLNLKQEGSIFTSRENYEMDRANANLQQLMFHPPLQLLFIVGKIKSIGA